MKTHQPIWRLLANLGDVNPLELGRLLYVDTTGVYAPELVHFDETQPGKYSVRRFTCERCTMLANDPATLSDNPFHADKPAWFADRLVGVASSVGRPVEDLARDLCGSAPGPRAFVYDDLAGYFGADNFDAYPIEMTATELRRRFRSAFRKS